MTNEEMRKAICSGIKTVDRRTLKIVYSVLNEALAPDDFEEDEELYQELERRSKAYKEGKVKTLSVAEVVARMRKRNNKRKL